MSREKPSKHIIARTRHPSLEETNEIETEVQINRRTSPRSKLSTEVLNIARSTLTNLGDAWKSRPSSGDNTSSKKADKTTKVKKQTTLNYLKQKCKDSKDAMRNTKTDSSNNAVIGNLVLRPERRILDDCETKVNGVSCRDENVNNSLKNFHKQMSFESSLNIPTINEGTAIVRQRPATIAGHPQQEVHLALPEISTDRPRKKLSFREPEIISYSNCAQQMRNLRNTASTASGGGPGGDTALRKENGHPSVIKANGSNGAGQRNGRPHLVRSSSEVIRTSDSYDDLELENQAMRVVRTVGEAFEVCHKLSQVEKDVVSTNGGASDDLLLHDDDDDEPLDIDLQNSDRGSDKSLELYNGSHGGDHHHINGKDTDSEPIKNGTEANNDSINGELNGQPHQRIAPPPGKPNSRRNMTSSDNGSRSVSHNDVQLLREQLEHQTQQTQAALAQLQLVTEQLSVERAARLEAQARTHQLLVHNKELLDHITALIAHLQDTTDRQQASLPSSLMSTVKQQQQSVCEPTSPFMRDINDSSFHQTNSPESPLRKNNAGNIFSFNSFNSTDQQIQLQQQIMQQLMQLGVSPYNTVNQFQFQQNPYAQSYQNMYNQQLNNNSILQSPTKKKIPPSPLSLRQTFNTPDSFSSTSFNDLYSTGAYSSLANINGETYNNDNKDTVKHFIKPLSQIGTLTATDEDGRVRLIVPVPPRDDDKVIESLVTLKITDEDGNKRVINNPPCITRSTSEKVPNRSELMSQVQRTMWARHTTK